MAELPAPDTVEMLRELTRFLSVVAESATNEYVVFDDTDLRTLVMRWEQLDVDRTIETSTLGALAAADAERDRLAGTVPPAGPSNGSELNGLTPVGAFNGNSSS
jgi:hypothetical protein